MYEQFYAASLSLEAERAIVIKLSRVRSVGRSGCLSSALCKNGGSDPDAVWHHRSDGSRDEAGGGVWRSVHGKKVLLGAYLGHAIVTNGDFTRVRVHFRSDAALFPNYFGQTCFLFAFLSSAQGLLSKPCVGRSCTRPTPFPVEHEVSEA